MNSTEELALCLLSTRSVELSVGHIPFLKEFPVGEMTQITVVQGGGYYRA